MKIELKKLENKYDSLLKDVPYSKGMVISELKNKLRSRHIDLEHFGRPLRIFWVGANYAQDDSGLLQALSRFGEVTYFTNVEGFYGLEFSSARMDLGIVSRNSDCLLKQVKELEMRSGKVDLVIGQMWANYISEDSLKKIQAMKIVTVNVSMDDRLPELWEIYNNVQMGAVGLVKGVDLTLTTTSECAPRFMHHHGLSLYWPLASDCALFKPADIKDIDVSFVGNNYGIRGAIVKKLMDAGVKIEAYGGGWPNGPVDAKEATKIFNRSKIILGIGTIGYCNDIYTMKLRDFDATMAGALYVTHRNPDLLKIFNEGEEIECYLNADEAVKKIKFYLENPEKIKKVGAAALIKSRSLHTWDKRIGDLLKDIGFKIPHV